MRDSGSSNSRAAQLEARQDKSSPWLGGAKGAAEYLDWPRERVYKRLRELPHDRHGERLIFRRDERDAFVATHREGRPA